MRSKLMISKGKSTYFYFEVTDLGERYARPICNRWDTGVKIYFFVFAFDQKFLYEIESLNNLFFQFYNHKLTKS
jgi:hypothetical protein